MISKEIGSEFCERLPLGNGRFNAFEDKFEHFAYLDCGRSAIDFAITDILQSKSVTSVYMPSYFCDSMVVPFERHGLNVQLYDVTLDSDGVRFDFDFNNQCEVVFLINYFGFENQEIMRIASSEKARGKTVIYDATQAIFAPFPEADYVAISFRKWMYTSVGMLLKSSAFDIKLPQACNEEYLRLKSSAAEEKYGYIYHGSGDKEKYLGLFAASEELLDKQCEFFSASADDVLCLQQTDFETIRSKRRANAQLLIEGLKSSDVVLPFDKLGENDVPMMVPVLISSKKRSELRALCRNESIYLPIHWPYPEACVLTEKQLQPYENELSIVCDQRYGICDMQRIIDVINSY